MKHKDEKIILGFSLGFDSGAAIVSNKRGIIAAINQERINREKNTKMFPIEAIKECLKLSDLSEQDIDMVAYSHYEELGIYNLLKNISAEQVEKIKANELKHAIEVDEVFKNSVRSSSFNKSYAEKLLRAILNQNDIFAPVIRVNHHAAHGFPAYALSGFNDSLVNTIIVTADGFGDNESFVIKNGCGDTIFSAPTEASIGLIYQFATGGIGFKMHQHEGKLTGMAARGNSEKTIHEFRKLLEFDRVSGKLIAKLKAKLKAKHEDGTFEGYEYFLALKEHVFEFCKKYDAFDIAAGVQRFTEEIVTEVISYVLEKTGRSNVCLSGGLFANVRLNQIIGASPKVNRIFVYPNMGDGGLGLGAALYAATMFSGYEHNDKLSNLYLGTGINDDNIAEVLDDLNLTVTTTMDRAETIATLIAEGNIVANVSGRMEYGPRALCNRSIHFHCDSEKVNAWLNKQLGRSEYMPFCPVIQYRDAEVAFTDVTPENIHNGEFMTMSFYASDTFKAACPSGVHVDGTARAQLIRKEINPTMHKALEKYKEKTGKLGFINTSFNAHGEPIVRTEREAIERFLQSNIHYLVINNFIIRHPDYDNIPKF